MTDLRYSEVNKYSVACMGALIQIEKQVESESDTQLANSRSTTEN